MLKLILALFMAFSCPAHNDNSQGTGTVVTTQGDPVGGDGGYIPPVPPPHKP